MDKLKTTWTLLFIFLEVLAVLIVVGSIYTFLGYILIFGALCLGGYMAFRLFGKSDEKHSQSP